MLIELREKTTGREYIEIAIKYILNIGEKISLSELNQKSKNISAEESAVIMTIAEKIYHDGKEEGKVENMHEMIEFAMELKFGLISKKIVQEINKIDDYERLKNIKCSIKSYDSLEELVKNIDI